MEFLTNAFWFIVKGFGILLAISLPLCAILFLIMGVIIPQNKKHKLDIIAKTSPETAFEIFMEKYRTDSFGYDNEKILLEFAEKHNLLQAKVALYKYFDNEGLQAEEKAISDYENRDVLLRRAKRCKENAPIWLQKAAKSGDLESIVKYYGFSDYNVTSNETNEILDSLNNVPLINPSIEQIVLYYRAIVFYKNNEPDKAKAEIEKILKFENLDSNMADLSKYMLFRCYIKENNTLEIEKMLAEYEKSNGEETKTIPIISDYLTICDIYYYGKDGNEPNYIKAFEFAEKYFVCKDADEEKANFKMGQCAVKIGELYYNGSNGFARDVGKAYAYFKYACTYGAKEAFRVFGYLALIGEIDGVELPRDYIAGNKYLVSSASAGDEKAIKLLEAYAIDSAIINAMTPKGRKYKFDYGYELTVSEDIIQANQLKAGILYKARVIRDEFAVDFTNKFDSFDKVVDGVHFLFSDYVAKMIQWGIKVLMSYGIDEYDGVEILNYCGDISLLDLVPLFERNIEKIDARAEQMHIKSEYSKLTRTHWQGGGFGTTIGGTIAASIKGSVAAGAMNIGSGILHGIGDSIVKAMNNSELKKMKKAVFDDPKTISEFKVAMFKAATRIGNTVLDIICENKNCVDFTFDEEISYKGEILSDLDDRTLQAKINNNRTVGNLEYVYVLQLENLKRNINRIDAFVALCEILDDLAEKELIEVEMDSFSKSGYRLFAGDFGYTSKILMVNKAPITVITPMFYEVI